MKPRLHHKPAAAGDMLAAALRYAALGWCVIPLHDVAAGRCSCRDGTGCKTPGKHPRINRWQRDASADPNLIAGWWKQWPQANVGILTGERSGLLVLDVDPRHDGEDTLATFEATHGKLPATVTVLTGGGGQHLYFAHPGGKIRSLTLGNGLELKADGTFVVAPPSRTGEKTA